MRLQSEPAAVGRRVGRPGARQEDSRRCADGIQEFARHYIEWIVLLWRLWVVKWAETWIGHPRDARWKDLDGLE